MNYDISTIIEEVCNADERTLHEASVIDYGGTPIFPTIEDILQACQPVRLPQPRLDAILQPPVQCQVEADGDMVWA